MTTPRRAIAAYFFIAVSGLSCGVQPPGREDSAAALEPFSYAAFESSEAAAAAARALADFEMGLLPEEVSGLAVAIAAESQRADLPIELVLAVIQVESAGDNFAVSAVGAMGLMQLMPATAEGVARQIGLRWTGPSMLFDPVVNVRLGVAYLQRLVDRYGSVATALAAYNWGPGRIAERLRQGEPIPASYAQRVLSIYAESNSALVQI